MKFTRLHPLLTDRLLLRKLRLKDAEVFYRRLGSSKEVTKHMLWQPHRELSESIASIEKTLRRYEDGSGYRWGITLKETDALIGIIDLLGFDETEENCSFAYMLGADFWGKGYGTEALKAVIDFAFAELEVQAIAADHFAENPASGGAMRKAGMTYIKTISGKYEKDGVKHDAAQYRITRSQWKKAQGQS